MLIERFFHPFGCLTVFVLAHVLALTTIGAEEKDKTPALKAEPAAKEEPAVKEEIAKPEKKDRYELPEGGVPELIAFLEELSKFRPTTSREYFEHRQKAAAAFEAAARKILELEKDEKSDAYQQASAVLMQLLVRKISGVDTEEQQTILDQVTEYLSAKQATGADLNLAMSTARALEESGAKEMAADAYEAFGEMFGNSENSQIASASEVFAATARRLNLVGNTLELQGTKLDGTKFDFAELKGKVVLVDFWATWCGPCVAEFPNIKNNYGKYREHGFEVVGISLDRDREKLEKYVEEKQVPWITLHEEDTDGRNPAAKRYAINSIPAMFLVGRDGNVISLRARGKELDRLLAEQFGDVATAEDADGAAQEPEDTET